MVVGAGLAEWRAVPDKPRDLSERTFLFSCDVVRFCCALAEEGPAHRHVSWQLLKAGTSVGANAAEATGAFSRKEFAFKNSVVLREARESVFWLRIIRTCQLKPPAVVDPLLNEANELAAIFATAVRRIRQSGTKFPPEPDVTQ